MVFLDPKSDIVFKKLFGTITHKNILMSFLNSALERSGNTEIVDVIINDPINLPETVTSKGSIVDIRCTDQRGNQYIVEMQVIDQEDFGVRAQYYSSLALSRQLGKGEKCDKLVPVIFIGVLNFKLFHQSHHYLSHHLILDNKTYAHELKHLEFHFIELTKFAKNLEQLITVLDKWIYFFKNAVTLSRVPQPLDDSVMQEAFNILEQGNWSRNELDQYDRYMDCIRSTESQLDTALNKGIAQGLAQGILEGKRQLAKQLIARGIIIPEEIATISGLDHDEIKKLKR